MNRSTSLVLSLVLLGGAAIFITRLMLDNYSLKVENASLRAKIAAPARPAAAPAPAAAAAPAPSASPARTIDEYARQSMILALGDETGAEKKLWIRVDPRDREASAFAGQISGVFKDQGWDVQVLDSEGLRFKPGLLFLVGSEDEPPSYVANAQKAIEAIGQDMTTGRGYLSYYESKKKEDPKWQGTSFLPGQTYVLLVGRKPEVSAQ
jgi:hypothetical protein